MWVGLFAIAGGSRETGFWVTCCCLASPTGDFTENACLQALRGALRANSLHLQSPTSKLAK
jgi:hypothetical protein